MDRKSAVQILATGSVILSLGFVGYELRQNTSVARMGAYQAFADGVAERNHMLATDPILTPLVTRVSAGAMPDEFSAVEQVRIRLNFAGLLRLWEGLYRSVQEGVLPSETLEVVGQGGAFNNPYFRSIWPTRLRSSFTEDFVEFFESLAWNSQR